MDVEVVFTGLCMLVYPTGADRPTTIANQAGDDYSSPVQVWLLETPHAGFEPELHRHVPRLTFAAAQYWSGLGGEELDAARQADGELVLSVDLTDAELAVGPRPTSIGLQFPQGVPNLEAPIDAHRSALDFLLPVGSLNLVTWVAEPTDHVSAIVSLHGGEVRTARLAREPTPRPPRPLLTPKFKGVKRAFAESFAWRISVQGEQFAVRRKNDQELVLVPDEAGAEIRLAITNAPERAKMVAPSWDHAQHYGQLFDEQVEEPSSAWVSNNSTGCPPTQARK